jgi:hypothetical protein
LKLRYCTSISTLQNLFNIFNVLYIFRASTPVQEDMKFHWKRDNVIISAHKGQVDTTLEAIEDNWQQKSSLHLININSTDAATYQCIVSNDYGTTFSKKAKVAVFSKLFDQVLFEKVLISIRCSLSGVFEAPPKFNAQSRQHSQTGVSGRG